LSLADVAERTRITSHHLEAIERSDLDALPPGPFGRSYIRSYAEVLGIDPAPILAAYHVQEVRRGVGTPERDQRMLQELSHLVGRGAEVAGPLALLRRPQVGLAAAVVSLALLGTVGWLLARSGTRGSPSRTALAPARTGPVPTPVAPPVPPSRPGGLGAPPARPTASPGGVAVPPRPRPPAPVAAGGAGPQTKPPAATRRTDTLQVSDFGVGSDVVDRRLVGRADRFTAGTRVSFWTLVVGGQPGHVVRHVWYQGGRAVMRTELPIGASHWRTRSSLVLPGGCAGPWTVEARTSDGRLLARNDFVCEGRRSR
jgi:hypothetical protein